MRVLFTAALWCAGAATALAAPNPDSVSFTLEGCRNNGGISLPNGAGAFICPDAAYTTGNLGKGWNELDLVPYRITTNAGNSAPLSQTYAVAVVLDAVDGGAPGFDVLSVPTLNPAKSSGVCSAATVGPEVLLAPGIGGTDVSRARQVQITQNRGSSCVYDYYGRLALGSHLFPGSSLHANLTNQAYATAGIGARDVSIPVREILPQSIHKDMSAIAASSVNWSLTKEATPTNVSFGDVCAADPQPQPVKITVKWTKNAATLGKVSITTHVYAKNPASRTITVTVTDKIYAGSIASPGVLLDMATSPPTDVGANGDVLVLTHTVEVDAAVAGGLGAYVSDVATATYVDKVTQIPVPGQTEAKAETQIQAGATAGSTVNVADLEKIDLANANNAGLSFSVAPASSGSFIGYTSPNKANSVEWGQTGISATGSIVFDKLIYLDPKRIVSNGVMTDTATLKATDGSFQTTAGPITVGISSTASVKLTLTKSIPLILGTGEKIEVKFKITAPDGSESERVYTFFGGGALTISQTIPSLQPGVYKVEEISALFFAAGSGVGVASGLEPDGGALRTVNLDVTGGDFTKCTGTATFVNKIPDVKLPLAQVEKTTVPSLQAGDPDFNWLFTLTGPSGVIATATAGAGAGFVQFTDAANIPIGLPEGNYTVTETLKGAAWALTSPVTNLCSFTVNLPQDISKIFSCSFVNTKQAKVKVIKTVSGAPLTGLQTYTFTLRKDASLTNVGTVLETKVANAGNSANLEFSTWLVPNASYQMCENLSPGWQTSLVGFVPGGSLPNPDNSVICENFTVAAGGLKVFAVNNTPPPQGRAHTIGYWKNWASCKASGGKQAPVLDQTLYDYLPSGIKVGQVASVVVPGGIGLFGELANSTGDCSHAVSLLNKQDFSGKKQASHPLYNMAAQLVAAELNLAAGAYSCQKVADTISGANTLLDKYGFTGFNQPSLTAGDAAAANALATTLDNYNNNLAGVCP